MRAGWRQLLLRLLAVLVVVVIAGAFHAVVVDRLPIDYDEDDYLRAGSRYATAIRAGDPGILLRENYRPEHPPLAKIVYGLALLPLEPAPDIPDLPTTAPQAVSLPQPHFDVARWTAAILGIAEVGVLALVDPLAGLLLAIDTWQLKYTGQVMLEALPALLSLLAVLAYVRAGRPAMTARRRRALLVAAALLFGATCAAKYPYGLAGAAIAIHWLWTSRPAGRWRSPRAVAGWLAPIAGWLALAFVCFLAFNPYLWPDPVGRLRDSLAFHGGYAQSAAVQDMGWPAWQPLVWLAGSVPFHENLFPVAFDLGIAILALVGSRRLWREHRVMAIWLLLVLAFLVLWPTKWPQYVLTLTAPLCLAAGLGARAAIVEPLGGWLATSRERLRARRAGLATGPSSRTGLRDLRAAAPWLVPGIAALLVLAGIPLLYEGAMALTDFSNTSLRDGILGGVMREAVGGLTGQVAAAPIDLGSSSRVQYVGTDLVGGLQAGIWLGDNTTAAFIAFSTIYTLLVVGLETALGLAVAIVLARPGLRFVGAWRTLFILPWAVPVFVGAIAWRMIVEQDNGWLALLLGRPVPWAESPEWSLVVMVVAGVWIGWPLMMLVATAGLRTIPRSVHEAAALDGAGGWQRLREVTVPLLLPLLLPAMVIQAIAAFNEFYLFYVLGPNGATVAAFSFFVFDSTRGAGLYSVSAAINILALIALVLLVAWFLRWRGRAERVAFA
jgi:ABC-type sugar transport system permease subunit